MPYLGGTYAFHEIHNQMTSMIHQVVLLQSALSHWSKDYWLPPTPQSQPQSQGENIASDHGCPSITLVVHHYRYTSMEEYVFKKCSRRNIDIRTGWCAEDGRSSLLQGHTWSCSATIWNSPRRKILALFLWWRSQNTGLLISLRILLERQYETERHRKLLRRVYRPLQIR